MTFGQVLTVVVTFGLLTIFILGWLSTPTPKFMCGQCGLWFRLRSLKTIIYGGNRIRCCPGCWMRIEQTKDKKFQGVMR